MLSVVAKPTRPQQNSGAQPTENIILKELIRKNIGITPKILEFIENPSTGVETSGWILTYHQENVFAWGKILINQEPHDYLLINPPPNNPQGEYVTLHLIPISNRLLISQLEIRNPPKPVTIADITPNLGYTKVVGTITKIYPGSGLTSTCRLCHQETSICQHPNKNQHNIYPKLKFLLRDKEGNTIRILSIGNTATTLLEKIRRSSFVFWDKWIKIVVKLAGNGRVVYRYAYIQGSGANKPGQRLFGTPLTGEEAERWGLTKTGETPLSQLPTKTVEKTLSQTIQLWFKRRYDHVGRVLLLTQRKKPGEKEIVTGLLITTKRKRGNIYITVKVVGLLLNPLPRKTPPDTPLLWKVNIYNGPTAKLLRYIPPRCEVVLGENEWLLPREDIYLHPCYHSFKPTEVLKLKNRIAKDVEKIVSQVKNTIVGNKLFGCCVEDKDVHINILPHTEQDWTTKLLGAKVVVGGDIISDDHGLIILAHHLNHTA